ncbi:bifunctional glycosyltransferase/CDP-glycerol:glycerophosphate glycerophosphotransferase [Avibacterium avium]|uniref:Glycosyl transferase, family 2 protein-3 n=1 Tax=Avibacterium avium TaxID=751 RepID=A0A379ATK0_AVIAV|nr:CDP-glycerol glycerophosphotransferase family protein [Avibacterium avium]SUB24950.1 glycosyl transferase, family 2 protein-3 [Avibacterium avium]
MYKKYIFSIIMPIYNVDKWLEEAINSVIEQQGFSFQKSVQLILVNDCSPDNSEEICLKYQKKYPNNVLYIKNEHNMGLSKTRNNGLKHAQGEYINFFDPDDILSSNVLLEVYKFFLNAKKNNINLAHVSIPLEFFEAANGLHPKYTILGEKNRIIDLNNEGYNFILSSASTFYPYEVIKNKKYDHSLFGEEDTLFNFEIYQKIKKLGYVIENGVRYYYRKRREGGSQVDQSRIKPQAFYTPINLIQKVKINRNSTLFYELCIYELRSRLKTIKPSIFKDESEYYYIINEYRKIMNNVPIDFVLKNTKFITDIDDKVAFITLLYSKPLYINKNGMVQIEGKDIFTINNIPVHVKHISLEGNILVIETLFNNYNMEDLSIVLYTDSKKVILPTNAYYTESVYIQSKAGIQSNSQVLYSKFEIPASQIGRYKLYIKRKSNGHLHVASVIRTYSESPFLGNGVFNSNVFKIYSGVKTSVSLYKKVFIIEKFTKWKKFTTRMRAFFIIKKQHNKFKWLRLLKLKQAKYWLFNDRPINANDNAEYFFEYINKNHKDIAKNSYFVLSKKSTDIDRIKKIGNVVIQNSLKHKFLYLNAKYVFTSHLATSFFKPISFKFLKYYNDLLEAKLIWLQHGITMNDIESAANKFNKQVSKVVMSASFEKQIFSQRKFFYSSKDIIPTGFPRHDKLSHSKENIILIMPTWRAYLSGKILSNGLHAEKKGFKNSLFYKNYAELLSNRKLLNLLNFYNYKIIFVLHPGFKQYNHYFNKFENKHVNIKKENSFSYNKLFNKSALLITDYSSVFFDFSYTMKPCLFFQFDKDDFYGQHYKKGMFDFDSMAPGPVFDKVDTLIANIEVLLKNNMIVDKKFIKRIESMYKYTDNNNSERLFREITKND